VRKTQVASALAICFLVGTLSVLAGPASDPGTGGKRAIKHIALLEPPPEPTYTQPNHVDREPVTGPVSIGSDMSTTVGSAIVAPTGGSFMSPRQRSEQAINGLIRKLG
jgi:hypothetical protein